MLVGPLVWYALLYCGGVVCSCAAVPCRAVPCAGSMSNLHVRSNSPMYTCLPSFPEMPTPICASWIMATSLAPSPVSVLVVAVAAAAVVVVTAMVSLCVMDNRSNVKGPMYV